MIKEAVATIRDDCIWVDTTTRMYPFFGLHSTIWQDLTYLSTSGINELWLQHGIYRAHNTNIWQDFLVGTNSWLRCSTHLWIALLQMIDPRHIPKEWLFGPCFNQWPWPKHEAYLWFLASMVVLCEETARFFIGIGLRWLHASDKVVATAGTQRMQLLGTICRCSRQPRGLGRKFCHGRNVTSVVRADCSRNRRTIIMCSSCVSAWFIHRNIKIMENTPAAVIFFSIYSFSLFYHICLMTQIILPYWMTSQFILCRWPSVCWPQQAKIRDTKHTSCSLNHTNHHQCH